MIAIIALTSLQWWLYWHDCSHCNDNYTYIIGIVALPWLHWHHCDHCTCIIAMMIVLTYLFTFQARPRHRIISCASARSTYVLLFDRRTEVLLNCSIIVCRVQAETWIATALVDRMKREGGGGGAIFDQHSQLLCCNAVSTNPRDRSLGEKLNSERKGFKWGDFAQLYIHMFFRSGPNLGANGEYLEFSEQIIWDFHPMVTAGFIRSTQLLATVPTLFRIPLLYWYELIWAGMT
jgi:hypothetical protein